MNAIKTATSARLRWVIDKLKLKEASISVMHRHVRINIFLLGLTIVIPTLEQQILTKILFCSTQKLVSTTTLQCLLICRTCVDAIQECHELWTARVQSTPCHRSL
jgi:hypothetical protein